MRPVVPGEYSGINGTDPQTEGQCQSLLLPGTSYNCKSLSINHTSYFYTDLENLKMMLSGMLNFRKKK